MKKKTKKKWGKGVGPRAIYGSREDKLLDEEYIANSCPMPEKLDRQDLDNMHLDEDDTNYNRRKCMAWNPTKANLSLSIDISNALDKAIEYLDSSERDKPSVLYKNNSTFCFAYAYV